MRITIEPTSPRIPGLLDYPKVSVEVPGDDAATDEMIELMKSALIAFGHSRQVVEELCEEEQDQD